MILILGILALIVAVVLWIVKAVAGFVFSFGAIGVVAVIVGLLMLMKGRGGRSTV